MRDSDLFQNRHNDHTLRTMYNDAMVQSNNPSAVNPFMTKRDGGYIDKDIVECLERISSLEKLLSEVETKVQVVIPEKSTIKPVAKVAPKVTQTHYAATAKTLLGLFKSKFVELEKISVSDYEYVEFRLYSENESQSGIIKISDENKSYTYGSLFITLGGSLEAEIQTSSRNEIVWILTINLY